MSTFQSGTLTGNATIYLIYFMNQVSKRIPRENVKAFFKE